MKVRPLAPPLLVLLLIGSAPAPRAPAPPPAPELAHQVEVRRTAYGVPHIRAENLRAAGYALAWVQLEDYGERVVRGLLQARGEMALHAGREAIDADVRNRRQHARARETYHLLAGDTRDVLEGFAAGVNRYVELHPEAFSSRVRPDFTGHDVHARSIGSPPSAAVRNFVQRLEGRTDAPLARDTHPEDGSNTWALAPERTRSGHAILLRNPHLAWTAGYYEAHLTVPGELNFYGDFRIGGPLGIIGGFNERLGWSTTNNGPRTHEFYALEADPERPDHYRIDGAPVPLRREEVTVEFRHGEAVGRETREFWSTPLGPVIHRDHGRIYIVRAANDGRFRAGEQFLRLMQARDLEEWKEAMRLPGRTASNYTYADADGNIFYVWNAALPALPHPPGGDTVAVPVVRSSDVWTGLVPFDSLPQLLNPPGGYLRNENDPFHFTNLHAPLDPADFPHTPEPRLRLRSQHGLELLHNERVFSLEDVWEAKHSMRLLLADRVKDDLVAAVRAASPATEVAGALALIEGWDNTAAAGSRGGVLFQSWWAEYQELTRGEERFRRPWSADAPVTTPRGLAHPDRAAEAFARAVEGTRERFGRWDVAWGEVHRVRRGGVDVPVGGCPGALGCFRVLSFSEDDDGLLVADRGDAWVLAVEFGDPPRAYSVLAYGQSDREGSPHHADQAAMFAQGRAKPVAFTEEDIERRLVRRYRPGLAATR